MDQGEEKRPTLDAIVVLGGEGPDCNRSAKASTLYFEAVVEGKKLPHLIVTGRYSGMAEPPEKPICLESKSYLIATGIPEEQILTEERSLDHLAAMIYTRAILDDVLKAKRIGLVTDEFNMKRSAWAARRVWPYVVFEYPVEAKASLAQKVVEEAVLNAWKWDTRHIQFPRRESWMQYLMKNHPFHAKNPPDSMYKRGIAFLKKTKNILNVYQ